MEIDEDEPFQQLGSIEDDGSDINLEVLNINSSMEEQKLFPKIIIEEKK